MRVRRFETRATVEQTEAWRKAKPGDIILVKLRSGNVQRFKVCESENRDDGCVYAQKVGQGPQSPLRRINAFEMVPS